MKMKKVFLLLVMTVLALAMALSFAGCDTDKGEGFVFDEYVSGEYALVSYFGEDKNPTIPSIYNGKPVTRIEGIAFCYSNIHTVTIPQSVRSIGSEAFAFCNLLHTVNLSEGLEIIEEYAFGYSSLRSITIPDTVTQIGESAFYWCDYLEEVVLSNSLTKIEDYLFYGCYRLQKVTIPESITEIGKEAFYWTNLLSLTIPQGVTSIGDGAFYGWPNGFVEIFNKSSVNLIQKHFVSYSSIGVWREFWPYNIYTPTQGSSILTDDDFVCINEGEDVVLVRYLGDDLEVTVPDGVTKIKNGAFYNKKAVSVILSDSVREVEFDAFRYCHNLSKLTLGKNFVKNEYPDNYLIAVDIEEIYNKSNADLSSLEAVKNIYTPTQGESKLSIKSDGFVVYEDETQSLLLRYVGNDTSVKIPSYVTEIDGYAFSQTDVTKITLPKQMSAISDAAFADCRYLKEINLDNVTDIGECAFTDCDSLEKIQLNNVVNVGERAFDSCDSLKEVHLESAIETMGDFAFAYCESLEKVVIGDDMKIIGVGAFSDCHKLHTVVMGKNVEKIGTSAFVRCYSLNSITIPASVTEADAIGGSAFGYCESLVEVINLSPLKIVVGGKEYGGVGYYARNVATSQQASKIRTTNEGFVLYEEGDDVLLVNYVGDESRVMIPSYVTEIIPYAFAYTHIYEVDIPSTVEKVWRFAFYYCIHLQKATVGAKNLEYAFFDVCFNLEKVILKDTVTNVSSTVFSRSKNLVIYCQAPSKPEGWDEKWNYFEVPVVWDCDDNS